jgi:hypothetical protein
MVKKNEIYHLHIPKTGGHWIREEILAAVRGHVNIYEEVTHYAWTPIKPTSYVICAWREPAKRTVSHYAYLIKTNSIPVEKLTVKDFFYWVKKNSNYLKNYQVKNILYSGPNDDIFEPNYEFLKNEHVNEELAIERIKSFEFFIRDTQMVEKNVDLIVSKMYEYFEISKLSSFSGSSNFYNDNLMSSELYGQLNQQEIQQLQELNNLDCRVYNDLSLFWNDGK